jgi:hypothetical protein
MAGEVAGAASVKMPARIIGVLGMHRSGTSCLTGSLEEAGLELGEAHTWNPHNLQGNRENQQFVDFNDAVLEDNGAAWDKPPGQVSWSSARIAQATDLLASHGHEPLFGFKDPRALLILDGWKAIFPDIEFVGIFRHPNAVARSLEKRSGKPWEESLKLWYAYNSAMYREYKLKPFPILNFDDDEETLDSKMLGVIAQMGLSREEDGEKFYNSDLKNNSESDGPSLPWKLGRLYKKLKKVGL